MQEIFLNIHSIIFPLFPLIYSVYVTGVNDKQDGESFGTVN